ncbi:MAG TPA: ATP synthase F1 subunit delta [Clostridia bacterium]|nr:ATP synthase F1 subunit delta [Clostridia bacterium]
MVQIIAKRYAYALLDVAKKEDKVEEYRKQLKEAIEIFQIDKVRKILRNKSIDKIGKMRFVEEILEGFNKEFVNFIKTIILKDRENLIVPIRDQFEALYKEYFNIMDVKVISAYPLKEETVQRLKEKLEGKFKKQVNVILIVDKNILGGLKLIIGNTIIDGSVKARLDALFKNLQQAV